MASLTVQVERWHDTGMAFVRSRASDAPESDKDVLRTIDYNVFDGTCLPVEYRIRAGALVSLMLHFPKREVTLIELRAFVNGDLWIADALVETGDRSVRRRGVGATPVDALVALAADVQYE